MGQYKKMWEEYKKRTEQPEEDEGWDANGSPVLTRGSGWWYDELEPDVIIKKNKCNHEWKYYMGFNDSYEYCIHCDEKRKPEEKEKTK